MNSVTTRYTLDMSAGLTQLLADGTNTSLNGRGRIGEQQPGGFVVHLGDALGSVRQVRDAAGEIILAQDYEPYGEVLSAAGSGTTSYGFTGEWTDSTGLVYLRARYYNPTIGRFQTRDVWPGDIYRPISQNQRNYAYSNIIT